MTYKIAVFASTNGTDLEAILKEIQMNKMENIELSFVFSNKPNCGAVQKAKKSNITIEILEFKKGMTREKYDQKTAEIVDKYNIDLIVLVGYMRLFSPFFVQKYNHKIINIHPSLLPKYPGMDLNVHRAVLDNKEKETGMTIHFVDESMDSGEIICQKNLIINQDETVETLKDRVQNLEKKWYPEVIRWFRDGKEKAEKKVYSGFGISRQNLDIPKPSNKLPNNKQQDPYLIIFNQKSGRFKLRNREKMIKDFFAKHNIKYHFFIIGKDINNLEDIKFTKINFNKIMIAGGDGTLCRAVDFFYKKNINKPIAFLPLGSINGFARILGVPMNSKKALNFFLNAKAKKMSIGIFNNKDIFLIFACWGKIAEIATKAESQFKQIIGLFSYIITALKFMRKFYKQEVILYLDGQKRVIKLHSIAIFFTHSAQKFIPLDYKEGVFQVFLMKYKSFWEIVKDLIKVYLKRWESSDNIEIVAVDKIKIEASRATDFHLDGESFNEEGKVFEIGVLDRKVLFLS